MENIKVKDRFVDEKTGIEYIKQGDYYLPNLVLSPEETSYTIGKYGRMKLNYLKNYKKARIYHYTTEIKQEKKYKVRIYDGVKIDSELLKKSHFYRLYVHYLYLFGKLPAKVHYEERSAEYYKAIDKMEKTSDEIRFIGKYEIQNINDVTKIKNELTENMNNLKENKKQLLKKYTKAEDIDKEKIKTKIENITFGISKISKEIQTCRKIINNTERGEKEQKLIEQREKENLNINHKNIKKEKFRIK